MFGALGQTCSFISLRMGKLFVFICKEGGLKEKVERTSRSQETRQDRVRLEIEDLEMDSLKII